LQSRIAMAVVVGGCVGSDGDRYAVREELGVALPCGLDSIRALFQKITPEVA